MNSNPATSTATLALRATTKAPAPGRDLFRVAIWRRLADQYPAPSSKRSANNAKPTLFPAVTGNPTTPNQITACSGMLSNSSQTSDHNRR